MDYQNIRLAAIEMGGLSLKKMNKTYEMFFDETNNPRLFRITEEGFNIDDKAFFILGGLVFEKNKKPSEKVINDLYKSFNLQNNVEEIKFKNIQQKAKTFLELLEKPKVRTFIEWIYENDYWIHYSYRDNFYYSIVDIIDSMDESSFGGLSFNRELKNNLYLMIKTDKNYFLNLLRQFNYPNITNQKAFVEKIITWIETMNFDDNFFLEYLRQSLKSYRKSSLIYLENNKNLITIEDYSDIYINLIVMYSQSKLIFDEEDYIEKKIQEQSLKIGEKNLSNYRFIDSKESKLVQLSDLTVGILRFWMRYLEGKTIEELNNDLESLNYNQKKTMKQFQAILYKSLLKNMAFKHGSGSNDFEEKLNAFYEYDF